VEKKGQGKARGATPWDPVRLKKFVGLKGITCDGRRVFTLHHEV